MTERNGAFLLGPIRHPTRGTKLYPVLDCQEINTRNTYPVMNCDTHASLLGTCSIDSDIDSDSEQEQTDTGPTATTDKQRAQNRREYRITLAKLIGSFTPFFALFGSSILIPMIVLTPIMPEQTTYLIAAIGVALSGGLLKLADYYSENLIKKLDQLDTAYYGERGVSSDTLGQADEKYNSTEVMNEILTERVCEQVLTGHFNM